MTDVDHVRFDDGFVSTGDYTQQVQLGNLLSRIEDNPNSTSENTLIVIRGLPAGSVVDNAIELGAGFFGIPVSDVSNGVLNLDFPTLDAEATAEGSRKKGTMSGSLGRPWGNLQKQCYKPRSHGYPPRFISGGCEQLPPEIDDTHYRFIKK